jgi:hypothetical protein
VILGKARRADVILALDTFSVALPGWLAAALTRRPLYLRIGGDFLWEQYVERTGTEVALPNFYTSPPQLNLKERLIFLVTKFLIHHATKSAFTTEWQKQLWLKPYRLSDNKKLTVIENYLGPRQLSQPVKNKKFLFAARCLKLKNLARLKEALAIAKKRDPSIELEEFSASGSSSFVARLASCYAVLIPSWSEVSPNLALEALELGKPFILTKYSGYAERFQSAGILVDPFDARDMAEKILYLANEQNYIKVIEQIGSSMKVRPWSLVAQDFLNLFSYEDN